MNSEQKNILWNAYKTFLQYKRLSNLLAGVLVILGIACAFLGHKDAAVTAGVIAFLAVFHAGICRENAKQLRNQVFHPQNRQA